MEFFLFVSICILWFTLKRLERIHQTALDMFHEMLDLKQMIRRIEWNTVKDDINIDLHPSEKDEDLSLDLEEILENKI